MELYSVRQLCFFNYIVCYWTLQQGERWGELKILCWENEHIEYTNQGHFRNVAKIETKTAITFKFLKY